MTSYPELAKSPRKFLAMTGYTREEFQALFPYFQAEFEQYVAVYRLNGKKRTKRRYSQYQNSPDKRLFSLIYLKQGSLQEAQATLFGLHQPDANRWLHLLHPLLNRALAKAGELPARQAQALAARQVSPGLPASERVGGFRLLHSIKSGMLLRWDRGFHDYDMVVQTRQRDAHVLSRLPAHFKPIRVQSLAAGAYLAYWQSSAYQPHKAGEKRLGQVIEYTITDPNLPGYGETHRLVTTFPRLVKRKRSNYKLKRAKHLAWSQPAHAFREVIEVRRYQEINPPITVYLPSQPMFTPETALI